MEKQMAEEEKQEAEIQQELAKPEDVTAYIEERQEQEADRPPEDDSERDCQTNRGPSREAWS